MMATTLCDYVIQIIGSFVPPGQRRGFIGSSRKNYLTWKTTMMTKDDRANMFRYYVATGKVNELRNYFCEYGTEEAKYVFLSEGVWPGWNIRPKNLLLDVRKLPIDSLKILFEYDLFMKCDIQHLFCAGREDFFSIFGKFDVVKLALVDCTVTYVNCERYTAKTWRVLLRIMTFDDLWTLRHFEKTISGWTSRMSFEYLRRQEVLSMQHLFMSHYLGLLNPNQKATILDLIRRYENGYFYRNEEDDDGYDGHREIVGPGQ